MVGFARVIGAGLAPSRPHAWQLHLAEQEFVPGPPGDTPSRDEKLQAIDREADSLAGKLRDIQRQDAEIRHLLGDPAAPAAGSPDARPRSFGKGRHRPSPWCKPGSRGW